MQLTPTVRESTTLGGSTPAWIVAIYARAKLRIIRYADSQGRISWASQPAGMAPSVIEGDIFGDYTVTDRAADVARLLAPIVPTNIICIGLNYLLHAQEGGVEPPSHPIVFMKSTGAVCDPGRPIEIPQYLRSSEVDYECELAVVIGRICRDIRAADALEYVLGYTCANDVSARDWQTRWGGGQFWRGKSFDTFAPLGPALVLKDEIPDPSRLGIRTLLNGEVMQNADTSDLIFDIPRLIEFLSGDTTLPAGTVILTGTPSGIGAARTPPIYLKHGDIVAVEIDGIGRLENPVRDAALG